MRFVDSNIVLYATLRIEGDETKREVARTILRADDLCVSTQVLGEFFHQATRTGRPGGLSRDAASRQVTQLRRFPVQAVTEAIVVAAVATCVRYQLSYWDAAIIEAARAIGADTVLSEDLSDSQEYGGVRVVNPFR